MQKSHPHGSGGGKVKAEDELAPQTHEQGQAILAAAQAAARDIRRVAQDDVETLRARLAKEAVEAAEAAEATRAAQRLLEHERRVLVELRLEAEDSNLRPAD